MARARNQRTQNATLCYMHGKREGIYTHLYTMDDALFAGFKRYAFGMNAVQHIFLRSQNCVVVDVFSIILAVFRTHCFLFQLFPQ